MVERPVLLAAFARLTDGSEIQAGPKTLYQDPQITRSMAMILVFIDAVKILEYTDRIPVSLEVREVD